MLLEAMLLGVSRSCNVACACAGAGLVGTSAVLLPSRELVVNSRASKLLCHPEGPGRGLLLLLLLTSRWGACIDCACVRACVPGHVQLCARTCVQVRDTITRVQQAREGQRFADQHQHQHQHSGERSDWRDGVGCVGLRRVRQEGVEGHDA